MLAAAVTAHCLLSCSSLYVWPKNIKQGVRIHSKVCVLLCLQPVAHALVDHCAREVLLLLSAAPAAAVVPAALQLQLPALLQQHSACKAQLQQPTPGGSHQLLS